jgi:hypothetical protein
MLNKEALTKMNKRELGYGIYLVTIIIFTIFVAYCCKADEFEKLQQKVEALEQAREDDAEQLEDPFYWSMREQIQNSYTTGYESSTSRVLKQQMLADSYPEYFDPNYNYNKRKKYIDMYDY